MLVIEYPTVNVKNFAINNVFIRGDEVSVEKYCEDNDYYLDSFEVEKQRFSNDGALAYQYYDEELEEWVSEFGFSQVVNILNYETEQAV